MDVPPRATEGRIRRWLPVVASFGVYVVPVFGPHAFFLIGEMLYSGLTRHAGGRTGAWVATEFAVAVAAQVVVAALVAWSLGGRRRLVVPVLLAPVLVAMLEVVYVGVIPTYFLIESEKAPEVASLAERCVIPHAGLIHVRTPADRASRPFTVWWAQRPDGGYSLVHPSGCETFDVNLPRPMLQPGGHLDFTLRPIFAIADGATVFERTDIPDGRRSWWVLGSDRRRFAPLEVPRDRTSPPVLSNDGEKIAWLEQVPVPDGPSTSRVHLGSVQPRASESVVDLSPLGPASYVLAAYDRAAGLIWLFRDDRLIAINQEGALVHQAEPPASIKPQVETWFQNGAGRLQWDAYKEYEAYWLAWSTPAGAGRQRIPLGRSITSAALDPTGRFVAVSTTTTVSIGSVRDAVYVWQAHDGREVFRRYLPTYTRSAVAFFAGNLFAYSDLAGTHVLQVPDR